MIIHSIYNVRKYCCIPLASFLYTDNAVYNRSARGGLSANMHTHTHTHKMNVLKR
jgi:hypothetical protein